MLNRFMKFIVPAGKTPLISEAKKFLRMQTVYGAGNHLLFSPNISIKETTSSSLPAAPCQTSQDKQMEILKREGKYSSIENLTVPKNKLFIGLTRHSKVLLNSVFVFAEEVRYTEKWKWLKEEAEKRNCGIAFLSSNQDVQCLKLVEKNHADLGKPPVCSYLIDHRAISLESSREWLLRPAAQQNENRNRF